MENIRHNSRLLLIVDPQIDFINGSLPVAGATEAMNNLARYVNEHGDKYTHICVTCDRHPMRHSSFAKYGGEWPPHCIESSVGAAVWPALMEALEKYAGKVVFLYKGEDVSRDEYSIFCSEKGKGDLDKIFKENEISEIDICGLAGDVCVASTLTDALTLYPAIRYKLLPYYTASLDNGEKVAQMINTLEKRAH
ncbi:MAG: isochorismatase family protein [Muribaculaceae bacterium]|nr:isochorismatase family protein [Muribaculaceae bacterium]